MQKIVVFEDEGYRSLLPLVYWRTVPELRVGFGSLWERIRRRFPQQTLELICRPPWAPVAARRLQVAVNAAPEAERFLLINARLLLGNEFHFTDAEAVQWQGDDPVVISVARQRMQQLTPEVLLDRARLRAVIEDLPAYTFVPRPHLIDYPWDLIEANEQTLHDDWERAGDRLASPTRAEQGVHLLNPSAIHVAPSARLYPGCVLDAESGPIYLDERVVVFPNAVIRGPCYIGPESLIHAAAVFRPAVSVGRCCKIGGEVGKTIIHAYSNKQHDGFLGHAYLGEWVNLGAGTVASDLKNTYGPVRVRLNGGQVDSGRLLLGPTLGDFAKTGIGQLLSTGTVLGFAAMVASGGFSPNFAPSFSWITPEGAAEHDPRRALEVARIMMARRHIDLTPEEEALFLQLPDITRRHESCPASS